MFKKKDITINYYPVYSIVIRNVFPKEVNKAIFDEAIINKKKFNKAKVGGLKNDKVKKTTRSNLSAFYDVIYLNRSGSILLKTVDDFFSNSYLSAILSSSPTPFNEFREKYESYKIKNNYIK